MSIEKSCLCGIILIQDVMAKLSDIFDAFGGATRLAEAIGITPVHAQTMKTRRRIPSGYWVDIVKAAERNNIRGITYERLAKLHVNTKKIAP